MKEAINSNLIQLFPFLQEDFVNTSNGVVVKKAIPKGETIFDEGDICGGVPFIIKGTVRVSKVGKNGKEINIYRVTSGETCILTVTSVLSNSPYPATAITEQDVEAIMIPFDQFKNFMTSSFQFQQYVYKLIIERFQEVLTLIDEIIFRSTDERIVSFLLNNSQRDGDTIEVTHDKIAIEIGTAREVVSRFLKEMERKGWIQLARGKVIVSKRTLLEEKMTNY